MQYTKIILPTRPQVDTIAAIFVLQHFGNEKFPGVKNAAIEIWSVLPVDETEASLNAKGIILIDIGEAAFDHHKKTEQITATRLVAEQLGVADDPALAKLLEFTERDDFYGKGTISPDPLDRAFGLPGLLAALNRLYPNHPTYVAEIAVPFIHAHYMDEHQRAHELPAEFNEKEKAGLVQTFIIKQRGKNLKVILIACDNLGMPGYLRSRNGGAYDVVFQRRLSGHVNVLTRPTKRVDLRKLAEQIRLAEAEYGNKTITTTEQELQKTGRIKNFPEWYFDPATNSLQNGGANPKDVPPTKIPKEEWPRIARLGLEFI